MGELWDYVSLFGFKFDWGDKNILSLYQRISFLQSQFSIELFLAFKHCVLCLVILHSWHSWRASSHHMGIEDAMEYNMGSYSILEREPSSTTSFFPLFVYYLKIQSLHFSYPFLFLFYDNPCSKKYCRLSLSFSTFKCLLIIYCHHFLLHVKLLSFVFHKLISPSIFPWFVYFWNPLLSLLTSILIQFLFLLHHIWLWTFDQNQGFPTLE